MNTLLVKKPGVLSLLQDAGRFGHHRIGLTNGGPVDAPAMYIANKLVGNAPEATAIECSVGGLELEARADCLVALTGGDAPLSINGEEKQPWRSYRLRAGDTLALGFARRFCRSYLAVGGGFAVQPSFDSCSTVVREGIGGLNGAMLADDDELPLGTGGATGCRFLPEDQRPTYAEEIKLRVIPGYQAGHFPDKQQRRFFGSSYEVTQQADRMGYRLSGPAVACDIEGILSEGICMGAIQVPADGQPIVLLQDRQTIGGYPKIGAALSLDTARLAQLMPGAGVRFETLSESAAQDELQEAASRLKWLKLEPCDG